jgi:HTH-type transcriptional regulator, competence development regulator
MGEGKELGPTLRSAREISGRSLKAVAEPAAISPAYLMKLERGEVVSPSPHVLHRLARVLGVAYTDLMRLAGYIVPEAERHPGGVLEQALSSQDLTEDEAHAVAAFLKAYRSRGR